MGGESEMSFKSTWARQRRRIIVLVSALAITALGVVPLCADNWPNWRGPTGNGVAPTGDFPLEWSADKNVLWKVPMDGRAGSSPVVWEKQIFITTARDGKNLVLCLDWQGAKQWEVAVGSEKPGKHRSKGSGCHPSPVTDGQHVWVYFKSGDLACIDFEGHVAWHKNLQMLYAEDTLWWDLGTSPVLTDQHVVVACVQSGPSYVAAFDKLSGEPAWKVDRMLDAPKEANQTYSTPVVTRHDDQEILLVLGADHITAHATSDGKELWRLGGLNPSENGFCRSIASPVLSDGLLVAPYDRGNSLTAVSLDGKLVWSHREISSDVPTPVADAGMLFVCNDKGRVACLEIATGKILWTVETSKNRNAFSGSPILVGKYLYASREDGTVFVFDTTGDHPLVATNELGEFTLATPAFVDNRILIRTTDHLFCIGKL
jgi:outer membrane protein assembly factor BamB